MTIMRQDCFVKKKEDVAADFDCCFGIARSVKIWASVNQDGF